MRKFLIAPILYRLSKLKYPTLLKIMGGLFLLTLFLPDPIPFVDEILLGLVTFWLSRKKEEEIQSKKPIERKGVVIEQ